MLATAIYGFRVVPNMRVPNLSSTVVGIAVMAFGVWFHSLARKKT